MPKQKIKKSLFKRVKITKTGKILHSHQLRTSHLRRHKSKRTLKKHRRPIILHKSNLKAVRRLLAIG